MKILKAMCAAAVALSLVGCAQTSNSDDKLTKVTIRMLPKNMLKQEQD